MTRAPSGITRSKTLATWIFGVLLLFFVVMVFFFSPEKLPEFKQRILALASAILAGLFGYFLTGSIKIKFTTLRTELGDVTVDAAGGFALFVLVMTWWLSPFAPVGTNGGIVSLRVTVLGSDKIPTEDAKVWSSIGGEPKKIAGGWEFEIPVSNLPQGRKMTIYAAQREAHLKGQREINVNKEEKMSTMVQLEREASALVKGTVVNDDGTPMKGVSVTILGSPDSSTTDALGFFSLPAKAAAGEEVRLHISKAGYVTTDQYHPAGDDPAYVVLRRKKR